jgi:uncharacterized protein YkwD
MRALLVIGLLLLRGVSARACDSKDGAPASTAPGLQAGRKLSNSVGNDPEFDAEAAEQLLTLVNQARAEAGLSPLAVDATLNQAAQAHGREMLQHGSLSHQFAGEGDLLSRLGQGGYHFNGAGENVALDYSAEHVHEAWMLSEVHRHNLLEPTFNAVGIAVLWSHCQMYVVQDFAHQVPKLDPVQAEDLIAEKVAALRTQTRLPRLNRVKNPKLSDACSLTKNKQSRGEVSNARYVLSYSNAEPQALPASAGTVIGNGQMKDFSVGACYARTEKNPNGAYFVTMMFY